MEIYNEFLNEIKTQLLSIIGNNNDLLDNTFKNVSNDYYLTCIVNDCFLKVATRDNFHFKSLCNEIYLVNVNFNSQFLKPKMIFTYCSENVAIKIEEKINAIPLGKKRDDFSIEINYNESELIKKINLISKVKLDSDIDLLIYNRNKKILKYINECEGYIDTVLIEKCSKIAENYNDCELVLSHGDLIPSNILVNNNNYIFVDWEWAAYRSKTYDLVLFLLFSNIPNQILLYFKTYFDVESLLSAYLDTIVISLHEIKNWKNEKIYIENKESKISMWQLTLKKAVDLIENFNGGTQI